MKLYWDTPEDIAEQLFEAQPETDPLSIRFTDLLRWVTDLEDFSDDPQDSSEGKLEAIQMAWLEIYKEEKRLERFTISCSRARTLASCRT